MVFNSLIFCAFYIVVFLIYWFPLKNTTKGQNIFLLLVSYFFYGYTDWRMLPLLIVATLIFYFLGKNIAAAGSERKSYWLTTLGVVLGVGTLLYFKYFNFFIESFAQLFEMCGLHTNLHTFNIIMPLGISFFTFRLLSYVIDIYRGKIEATNDVVAFAAYIAFFPCLLSGPIDRPSFISQITSDRTFEYAKATDGLRQFLWGLFKKAVIADNCAAFVDKVWMDVGAQNGSTLALAAVFYLFQIYADFSGYSDMAIGVGKLLGFHIADNFKFPLFALNIADYWRRWHITLTSWLTDYVFMPLNIKFRDWGNWGMILSIIITFVLIGMWHGANLTFALFGLYHGLLYIPLIVSGAFFKKAKLKTNKIGLPVAKDFGRMTLTFVLVVLGLIVFRADSLAQAWEFIHSVCNRTLFTVPELFRLAELPAACIGIAIMLVVEWLDRNNASILARIRQFRHPITLALCYASALLFILALRGGSVEFVYFHF